MTFQAAIRPETLQNSLHALNLSKFCLIQGTAPGRMKGLLVSYNNDLYLYGGMPHTAFTAARALNATSFAYPDNESIFMKLCHGSGKWQSVSCLGAVPESRTRIHSGHAGPVFCCFKGFLPVCCTASERPAVAARTKRHKLCIYCMSLQSS